MEIVLDVSLAIMEGVIYVVLFRQFLTSFVRNLIFSSPCFWDGLVFACLRNCALKGTECFEDCG